MEAPISPKFLLWTFTPYDGTIDSANHIHNFESNLVFHRASDAVKCLAFVITLRENTQTWFESLPGEIISSFQQLKKLFKENFFSYKKETKSAVSLFAIMQVHEESLCDFMSHFQNETLCIPCRDVSIAMIALRQGTRDSIL